MRSPTFWITTASLLAAVGVALGAFGAHGLRSRVGPELIASWQTAVQYHLIHSIVILALGLASAATGRSVVAPAAIFAVGILLFSGSIYGLVLSGPRWLGPITPLGGLCFIAGWIALVVSARSLGAD